MTTSAKKHNCKSELKDVFLKVTPARLAVLEILESSDKPLDVASISSYLNKRNIRVDKATVFRIINMFTDKGLATPFQFQEGRTRYEYTPHSNHHHFICESCGAIEDISDCNIDVLERVITKKKGFLVKKHALEFYGLCKNCQK